MWHSGIEVNDEGDLERQDAEEQAFVDVQLEVEEMDAVLVAVAP